MQNHAFNDLEGLRIAVEMERRGENFYRRAAKVSRSQTTIELLNELADDEQAHADQFRRLYEQALSETGRDDTTYCDEVNAYLSAVAADIVFPGGLMAVRHEGFDSPVGVLLTAIASEKDSILFYTELAEAAQNQRARDVFRDIVKQERFHMSKLQNQLMQHKD